MRHGIPGTYGSRGNEESATCRSYSRIENPNPTLSASYNQLQQTTRLKDEFPANPGLK